LKIENWLADGGYFQNMISVVNPASGGYLAMVHQVLRGRRAAQTSWADEAAAAVATAAAAAFWGQLVQPPSAPGHSESNF
jgi:hypothetical protein